MSRAKFLDQPYRRRSYGIWSRLITPAADGDTEAGFLPRLDFETYEAAEHELRMIDDEKPGVILTVREKA